MQDLETIKKAAFLHDLGKILNWKGYLHCLEGGRVLKHLKFSDAIVAAALYHQYEKAVSSAIDKNKALCAGLPARDANEEIKYAVRLTALVDKVVSRLDRLGEEEKAGRTQPVVLRNPLSHLPLNGRLKDYETTIELRDMVRADFLSQAPLVPLANGDKVYDLSALPDNAGLLKVLEEAKALNFNAFYQRLKDSPTWQELTLRYIPQGHHPPTDTLALWYHLQFSSALAPLYPLEGFKTEEKLEEEAMRLGKQPLNLKIGLLYIKLRGMDELFASSYRLPDFDGSQTILRLLREAVHRMLLELKTSEGFNFVWEDSFLYEGHDDFLVMIPVEKLGDELYQYVYSVEGDDAFLSIISDALTTKKVLQRVIEGIMEALKDKEVFRVPCEDIFGDGEAIAEALEKFISVELAVRCFARFESGDKLTPLYGLVWNEMRREVEARLREEEGDEVGVYTGELCDACRRSKATSGLFDAVVGRKRLLIWRSEEEAEADKLCFLCLARRALGTGTWLDEIAEEGEIALIKGNVDRTLWYIGGMVTRDKSVYEKIWWDELCLPDEMIEQFDLGVLKELTLQALFHLMESQGQFVSKYLAEELTKFEKRVKESYSRFNEWVSNKLPSVPLERREALWEQQRKQMILQIVEDFTKKFVERLICLVKEPCIAYESLKSLGNVYTRYLLKGEMTRILDELNALVRGDFLRLSIRDDIILETAGKIGVPRTLVADTEVGDFQFIGSPHAVDKRPETNLPTPSRTMTVSWLVNKAMENVAEIAGEEEKTRCIYAEGDEFLIICDAQKAPKLAQKIFQKVVGQLNSLPEGKVVALHHFFPFTLSMGMVVAKQKFPMYHLMELSDLLLASAKAQYRANAIDFEDVTSGVCWEYLADRENLRKMWLSRRPLGLSEFVELTGLAEELLGAEFAKQQLHLLLGVIREFGPEGKQRQLAAASYALKQETSAEVGSEEGRMWGRLKERCEAGNYQDFMSLWNIIRRKEEAR